MGYFSWKTSDTNESIPNCESDRPTFKVHMITRDRQVFTEERYEGYGEFGGKDFYILLAELNGITGKNEDDIRNKAIKLYFSNNPCIQPKLVECLPHEKTWEAEFDALPNSEDCEYQGFFYPKKNICERCGVEHSDNWSSYCEGCDEYLDPEYEE